MKTTAAPSVLVLSLALGAPIGGALVARRGSDPTATTPAAAPPVRSADRSAFSILAAGRAYTVIVTPDGEVWAWGDNSRGQLGDGTRDPRPLPGRVPGLPKIAAVAAGDAHALALARDGRIWTWGEAGSSAAGSKSTPSSPTRVELSDVAVGISAGGAQSFAWSDKGELWAWSAGKRPAVIATIPDLAMVVAGDRHAMALTRAGEVWAWGEGWIHTPQRARRLPAAESLAAGGDVTAVLGRDGRVSLWRRGSRTLAEARPGPPSRSAAVGAAFLLELADDGTLWRSGGGAGATRLDVFDVVAAAAGAGHGVAVTREGAVWAFGANERGQLGDGTHEARPAPVQIAEAGFDWKVGTPVFTPEPGTHDGAQKVSVSSATPDARVHYTLDGKEPTPRDPAVGSGDTILLDRTATLLAKAWKEPMPPSNTAASTYRIGPPRQTAATSPAAAGDTPVAGAITPGPETRQPSAETLAKDVTPASFGDPNTVLPPTPIDGGASHALLKLPGGNVMAWGSNASGQLGDGSGRAQKTPITIPGLGTVLAIASGASHSLALKSDGSVWSFGSNGVGQLGDNTTTNRPTPVQVKGSGGSGFLTGVTAIAAGGNFSLALRSDGTVFAWGAMRTDNSATARAAPATRAWSPCRSRVCRASR
jgi:alpha-tubulin suppressor-like RCC1 family protein